MTDWVPTIGLEVHLQLKTASKIFCGCPTTFGAPPNSQVCPVCLGLPGVLPVLNRQVLRYGVRVALALGCRIQPMILFHRKNYFYPDLPKGYQISQYDLPLGTDGVLEISNRYDVPRGPEVRRTAVKVRIRRVHMEEDAGKLIHKAEASGAASSSGSHKAEASGAASSSGSHKPDGGVSLVDLNRAGVPLLEIVSEPDLKSPEQAYEYLKTLKGILGYLDVSDCDMEKGSLRCDANISLSKAGPSSGRAAAGRSDSELGVKVEIKNLNSFRAVARALSYEVQRQTAQLAEGEKVLQETRLWDDARGITQGMRSKEYAHDYRYFPEPDLVPFAVEPGEVEEIRRALPELPAQRAARLSETYDLPRADAAGLTATRTTADYFEACVKLLNPVPGTVPVPGTGGAKAVANWILGELYREMNERNLDEIAALGFPPASLVELLDLVDSGRISGKMAKEVLAESVRSGENPARVVEAKGLTQVTDRQALRAAGAEVLKEHAQAVGDYRKGKPQALMFLVGQLMRRTRGAANPALSQEILRELLEEKNP